MAVRFNIEVLIPDEQAAAFGEAMTGNDDDVILAAETAIRERLGRTGDDEVELRLTNSYASVRDQLGA